MTTTKTYSDSSKWTQTQKFLFRIFFIYFFIQSVPLDWKFYRGLFSINWLQIRYGDIFTLAHYTPDFFSGPQTYLNWGVIALISLIGAFVWQYAERNKQTGYDKLYYWIRVIVRYRLAIAVIAYGFLKLYPLQAPYPSISNLNTNYGDFTRWKLFSLSLGIVPSYQSFLGAVEIVTGLLLLYRKTASVGAFIVIIFTGNVFMSNLAYEGGEHVYSLYLITLALFILAFDIKRLTNLVVFQKPTMPNRFKPLFDGANKKYGRLILKSAFIFFFVIIYGFKVGTGYETDSYKVPTSSVLPENEGIYDVSYFRINGDTLAYSKTDPIRWKDVVFEKWATISIRSNREVIIDSADTELVGRSDNEKNYELEGSAGRHYYNYQFNSAKNLLILENKNKNYKGERYVLSYSRPDDKHIILSGSLNERDSVYIVLDKINKKYLLQEVEKRGRQKPLKL